MTNPFDNAELIYSYSRAQAIADGVLVDVTDTSERREAGIRFPVAMTASVYSEYVKVPEGVACQDEAGRLWDILYMFAQNARRSSGREIRFQLYVRNNNRRPKLITLKALVGPGDNHEPVITIMRPEED